MRTKVRTVCNNPYVGLTRGSAHERVLYVSIFPANCSDHKAQDCGRSTSFDSQRTHLVRLVALRPEGGNTNCLYLSSYIGVPADSPQVNWWICSHKDVSPIICKAVVNDSSCEAGMHHFQADLSLTSHSRVLLIQIYIWQDSLWAYIKWIRTPLGHSESSAKWKRRH